MRRPAGRLKKENHAHARTPPPTHTQKTYRHPGVGAPDPQELGRLGGDQALKVVRPGGPHGVRPLAVKAGERGEGAGEGAARARQGRRGRWETKKKTIHPSTHPFLWSRKARSRPAGPRPACPGGRPCLCGRVRRRWGQDRAGRGGGGEAIAARPPTRAGGRAAPSLSLSSVPGGPTRPRRHPSHPRTGCS